MSLKYIQTEKKWFTCSWGNKPQSAVALPQNSTNFISIHTYTKFIEVNGRKYSFMPKNIIAIDVDKEDIAKLIEEGIGREPNENELSYMDGYISRR